MRRLHDPSSRRRAAPVFRLVFACRWEIVLLSRSYIVRWASDVGPRRVLVSPTGNSYLNIRSQYSRHFFPSGPRRRAGCNSEDDLVFCVVVGGGDSLAALEVGLELRCHDSRPELRASLSVAHPERIVGSHPHSRFVHPVPGFYLFRRCREVPLSRRGLVGLSRPGLVDAHVIYCRISSSLSLSRAVLSFK